MLKQTFLSFNAFIKVCFVGMTRDHEIIQTPLAPLPLLLDLEVAFAVVESGSHNFNWFMCQISSMHIISF